MICDVPRGCSLFWFAVIAVFALPTAEVFAQVNGPGISDSSLFDNVINLPIDGNLPVDSIIGGVAGETTQINITDGGSIGFFSRASNTEVNITGGSVADLFELNDGEFNIDGGTVFVFSAENSVVNFSGGTVVQFDFIENSVLNISGGDFDFSANTLSNSGLNFIGSEFSIDGVRLDVSGTPVTVNDRDVPLSGVLEDGSMFSTFLNPSSFDGPDPNNVFLLDSSSTVTVTFVPEPSTLGFLVLLSAMRLTLRSRT